MTIEGHLSEFSLAEIFQLLEHGKRTGRLTIQSAAETGASSPPPSYYIWFKNGRIVAAADRLDKKGLLSEIERRGWLREYVAKTIFEVCGLDRAMGICLKEQGALKTEQLKLLFVTQVMRQICALLALKEGEFSFQGSQQAPVQEMTGLSKPATEMMFVGLRALKNWPPALLDKLPAPTVGIASLLSDLNSFGFNAQELQVWEYADGTTSLQAIAKQRQLPLETVQKIAFRLSICNLAEETAIVAAAVDTPQLEVVKTELSTSFLDGLTSVLRARTPHFS